MKYTELNKTDLGARRRLLLRTGADDKPTELSDAAHVDIRPTVRHLLSQSTRRRGCAQCRTTSELSTCLTYMWTCGRPEPNLSNKKKKTYQVCHSAAETANGSFRSNMCIDRLR